VPGFALTRGRGFLTRGSPVSNLRYNEQIRISPVRVINENNEQLGVMDNREALRLAREAGLDLVEVAPNERPPVCRIMDYGRFKYHQKKNIRRHHEQQIKELRIRPKTDDHDRAIRIGQAIRFLRQGDKVQFKMMFRGRERAHREIGVGIFHGILQQIGELARVERPPAMDGRDMVMVLSPNKAALDRLEAGPRAATRNQPAPPPQTAQSVAPAEVPSEEPQTAPAAASAEPPPEAPPPTAPPLPEAVRTAGE
jgi:translation initiation factor IF-3